MKKLVFILKGILLFTAGFLLLMEGIPLLAGLAWGWLIVEFMRHHRARIMKITRWSKAHPLRARILITILQAVILFLGIWAGYTLQKTGLELPASTALFFGLIMLTGFIAAPFLPRKNWLTLPAELNRNRLAYISICISSFMLMVYTGSRLDKKFPGSAITSIFHSIDQGIFPAGPGPDADLSNAPAATTSSAKTGDQSYSVLLSSAITVAPSTIILPVPATKAEAKAAKKAERVEKRKARLMKWLTKKRSGLAAGLTTGGILLIILLVATTCGGICLAIAGFGGGSGLEGVALGTLGVVVAGASIWGIKKVITNNKRKNINQ